MCLRRRESGHVDEIIVKIPAIKSTLLAKKITQKGQLTNKCAAAAQDCNKIHGHQKLAGWNFDALREALHEWNEDGYDWRVVEKGAEGLGRREEKRKKIGS